MYRLGKRAEPKIVLKQTAWVGEAKDAHPWPTHMQLLSTQVLLQSRREQEAAATQRAERRALREQTTSLHTERARLQGELAALRTRLIQVLVLRQKRFLEMEGRAARSGEDPRMAREWKLGKERLAQQA